jgi:hypothetical protein
MELAKLMANLPEPVKRELARLGEEAAAKVIQAAVAIKRDPDVRYTLARAVKRELSRRGVPFFHLWSPLPGPQTAAFETEAFETLYGGAAGGGKSDLLIGVSRIQGKRSVIFRRTYPQLEDSIIPRTKELFGSLRHYNASKHYWWFEDGVQIRFRFLENEDSLLSYQGAAFDTILFDELTQFSKLMYEYMFSRCRTTRPGQRCRIIASANPGGEGEDWVIERWAPWLDEGHPNPAKSGEIRWFVRFAGDTRDTEVPGPDAVKDHKTGEEIFPRSRTFIKAVLKDNPYLDANNEYRGNLQTLPEPFRSQLLNGDWTVGRKDDAYQIIPTAWIKAAMDRWRPDGWKGKKPSSMGLDVARGGNDQTIFQERRETWFARPDVHQGRTTTDGPSVIAILLGHTGPIAAKAAVNVDVIGVGSSVYDTGRLMGLNVRPVNFAERSNKMDRSKKFRFVNKRAEGYWLLREALDPEYGSNLALPPDQELLGDLRAPRFMLKPNGIQVESKDEIKARIGRSPDKGDAVVLANMETELPTTQPVDMSKFGR